MLCWLALLLAVGATLVHNWYLHADPWMPDDAYISLRFAENFAEGRGIVYNEGERVEGYTNFLWVVLLGAGHRLGLELVPLARALCLAFSLGTLLLVAHAHRFVPNLAHSVSALAVLMLGTCGVFTGWAFAGMEVPLVAFWVVLSLLINERAKRSPARRSLTVLAAVCCVLAAMSRPDAGLVFVVLFADRFIEGIRKKNRGFLLFAVIFAALYGGYFLWRFNYYGYLLPNTFYAKVGGTWKQFLKGMDYTASFMGAVFFVLAPVVAAFLMRKRAFDGGTFRSVLVAFVGLYILYVTLVGGDFMACFRFYGPAFPAFCLLGAMAVMACRPRPLVAVLFAMIIIAHNTLMIVDHRDLGRRAGKSNVSRYGRRVGLWLWEHADPDALLATNTAGTIPFYSKLRTVDMLGLCDVTIAHREVAMGTRLRGHEKGDGQYVLSRKPDYIHFASSAGSEKPMFRGDNEIYRSAVFRRDYVFKIYRMKGGGLIRLYVRKPEAGGKPIHAQAIK